MHVEMNASDLTIKALNEKHKEGRKAMFEAGCTANN